MPCICRKCKVLMVDLIFLWWVREVLCPLCHYPVTSRLTWKADPSYCCGWGSEEGGRRCRRMAVGEGGCTEEAEQMPGQLKGLGECDECGQSVKAPWSHRITPKIYCCAWRGLAEIRWGSDTPLWFVFSIRKKTSFLPPCSIFRDH